MDAQLLMGLLDPYQGKADKIVEEQTTGDIIEALLKAHREHVSDYAKISSFFAGGSKRDVARKIYNFLRKNVKYRIESSNRQTVTSPASLLALGRGDCKHYSLFSAGILQNLGIPFAFRFASYKPFDRQPQHVFVVVDPNTDREIWIDPVISSFDYKKPYTYAIDKKMAVYKISGIGATPAQKAALKAAKQQKKAAATTAQKKAAKTTVKAARKAAGRTTGQVLKKGARVVLKVAAAPVRNSFLLLVTLNFAGLANKLAAAWDKQPTKLRTFWEGAGGKLEALKKAWEKGSKKKRIFGDGMIGVAPAAPAAAAATAAPLLVKVADVLRSIGIDPAELVQIGKDAVNAKAQELAKKALEPKAAELATDIDVSDQVFEETPANMQVTSTPEFKQTTDTGKMNYLPLVIGGAAVVYFLTRKK
jgi:hypothetical protein